MLWLVMFLGLFVSSSASAQTVYRWIADNVDFGETESPWNNSTSWAGGTVPPSILLDPNDVVELNGDGGNGFGSNTKEITINAATGSMTVGTLRFGDRDSGSALIIEDSNGNPTSAQTEGIIFDTSTTGDGASDTLAAALYHGLDNLGVQDARGVLSVGSDVSYGTNSDAFEVGVTLRDADGFIFDGFWNFRVDGPMTVDPSIVGGADFWKRGQGILFFDENDDTQATNGSLIGVKDLFVEEGELRMDGDNTDPDGVVVLQTQGNAIVGVGSAVRDSREAANARSVLPTLRLWRNNTGATISSTYTGTSATSEIGGNLQLNTGSLYISTSSIGGGAGEATVEPDIVVSGPGNQLELNRANNNSESVLFTGDISGTGELFKDNNANMVSTANNTFAGILGVANQSDADGGNQGGLELAGADGAFSAITELRLFNNGSLQLTNGAPDETDGVWAGIVTAVNNDRINDAAVITMQDLGKLEIVGNDTNPVSETLGAVNVPSGLPSFEFDLQNGTTAGQINLTLASITRAVGSELRFRVEDGYNQDTAAFTGAEISVTVTDGGTTLAPNISGGGGAAGSTTMNVVRGVTMGIGNNYGDRIVTLDGTTLRMLDHDPASPNFEFLDATGSQTGGGQQLFDSNWNTTNGNDQNVMWYFSENTPRSSTTPNAPDFENGRVIFDNVTINSAYITGLNNSDQGGNDNLRKTLHIDDDATLTITSGVLHISRNTMSNETFGTDTGNPDKVQEGTNDIFIVGGTINLGQEGFLKQRTGGTLYLVSDIVTGSGGLTVASPNSILFHGEMDLGGGNLTINEGALQLRHDAALTNFNEIHLEASADFIIRDGVHLGGTELNPLIIRTAPNANSTTGTTATPLRSDGAGASTVSNAHVILNNYDQLGEAFGTNQISLNAGSVLNLENVYIFSDDPTNRSTSDVLQADPQIFQFFGETSVLNFDGIISDVMIGSGENGTGVLAPLNPEDVYNTDSDGNTPNAPITSGGFGNANNVLNPLSQENFHLRVRVDGGNLGADRFNPYQEVGDNFSLNFERSGQQFNGAFQIGNGIVRFVDSTDDNDGVADGQISFFHDEVANSRDFRDYYTSFRLVDDITGNDNRAVLMLTQPNQVFNIHGGDSRVDTDSSEDNFAIIGYSGLTGSAQFGDTTYNVGGGFGKRLRMDRELFVFAAGDAMGNQGTLNMRMGMLDDGGRDSELTKIGRGIVNLSRNPIADEGSSLYQFDFGLNMFGGELHFDFDFAGDTGAQFTSNDTNAASTPDLRFQGGALRVLGDTNETRNWNNIDGDLIVNQGHSEFEYRARGGNATITAGGSSSNIIRTAGGALNFVVDAAAIGGGTFKATYENITIATGSGIDIFDSRLGGAFTVGGLANTVANWAAFDDEFELGELADASFNGANAAVGTGLALFGTGVNTQIEDAAVASTGESTGSLRIDAATTLTFSSATATATTGTFLVEDGILIPSTNAGPVVFDGDDALSGGVITGATMANELLIHNYGSGGLDIQNAIVDNGAKTDLTIGGTGTTTLSGPNTHTGNTYVNGGQTVIVDADSDFGTFDVTNGYGIKDVLLYYAGDNYETGTDTTLTLVTPLDPADGVLTGSEVAPDVIMELVNDQGIRNIRIDPAGQSGSGYVARPIAVFDDILDTSGTNHGQGARATVVLDGGNIELNGGTLHIASSFELNPNRTIVLEGNGGGINIADGEILTYNGFIVPERATSRNNANGQTFVDYFSGDLDINADGSTGILRFGALVNDNSNSVIEEGGLYNSYGGVTNIYGGVVQLFGQPFETNDGNVNSNSSQAYIQPFGTAATHEDGTVIHGGAVLNIMFNAGGSTATAYDGSLGNGNNNLNDVVRIYEWFTMKDGAFIQEGTILDTEQDTETGRTISLDGVITIEDNANAFFQSEGGADFLISGYNGELVGGSTSRFVKLGDSNIRLAGAMNNFEGQFVVIDGVLEFNNHGNVDGSGTSDILVGGNLMNPIYTGLTNPISLPSTVRSNEGTGTVGVYIRDDGGMPGNTIQVDRNIVLVDDGVSGTTGVDNNYRIGAWFMADTDRALYTGDIDMTDLNGVEQVQFYYRDDLTSRNNGSPVDAERAFIEFSGNISGTAYGRTVIEQGGTGNGIAQQDELDYHAYFIFSGDNSNWGSAADRVAIEIGLRSATIDTDRTTYWRAGSDLAFNENQDMFLKMGSRLQAGGNNVTIGNLVSEGDATNRGNNGTESVPVSAPALHDGGALGSRVYYGYLENGSTSEGTITIRQTSDHNFTGLIRNGFDPLTSSGSGELGGELQHGGEVGTTEGAALNLVYTAVASDVNLTLTERNTYTGTTEVQEGILQIGSSGDGTFGQMTGGTGGDEIGSTGTGVTTVSGGTLAGTGNVRGSLVLGGGVVAPGDTGGTVSGTLFVGNGVDDGSLTMNSGTLSFGLQVALDNVGTLDRFDPGYDPAAAVTAYGPDNTLNPAGYGDLNSGFVPGQFHDHLEISGGVTWTGGTVEVTALGDLANPGGSADFFSGDAFNLVDWFGLGSAVTDWGSFDDGAGAATPFLSQGGAFGDFLLPDLTPYGIAFRWDTSLWKTQGVLLVVTPEPARVMLLGLGLGSLLLRRRRKMA